MFQWNWSLSTLVAGCPVHSVQLATTEKKKQISTAIFLFDTFSARLFFHFPSICMLIPKCNVSKSLGFYSDGTAPRFYFPFEKKITTFFEQFVYLFFYFGSLCQHFCIANALEKLSIVWVAIPLLFPAEEGKKKTQKTINPNICFFLFR